MDEEGADRLVQAVEGGADVHQPFVDFQGAHIALVEHRIGADLDVVGAGRRIGDDAVGLEHPDGFLGFAKYLVQAMLQQVDRILGRQRLRLILEVAAAVDVVQVFGQHHAQVGQGRVAGVERVGRGAVQLLGDQAEILGAARFEHAHHHAVFLAHAAHDLADRVELAELAGDVALDVLELQLHFAGIERQRPVEVVVAVHRRHFLALGLEEALANVVVPLDRIEDADRRLRQHDAIGQNAYRLLVIVHPKLL